MKEEMSRNNLCIGEEGIKKARVVSKGLVKRKQVTSCHTPAKILAVTAII